MSKYGNIRTSYNGQVYDSKGEAGYARHLECLKAAGAITDWRRGEPWVLLDGPRRADRIEYTPDFHVWDAAGAFYAVDFKGRETEAWRIKRLLWRHVYPTIPLVVARADGSERRVA